MSWFKQNYEKAMLGVGVLSLVGVGTLIALNAMGGEEGKKSSSGPQKEEYGESSSEAAAATLAKLSDPATQKAEVWRIKKISPTQVARLMVGPPLIQKAGIDEVVDALDPKEGPVRGEVPNEWLLKYGLDITRSKILDQDPDNDKFTNAEEFAGNSNPVDPQSKPNAVMKLKLAEVIESKCELKFTVIGPNDFQFRRTREDGNKSNLTPVQGQLLWDDDKRFKWVSVKDGVDAENKPIKIAVIEDMLNPVGSPFELKEKEVVNRPTFQAKVLCTLDNSSDTQAEGAPLTFPAFPNIKFTLSKINIPADPEPKSVEIIYVEAGRPAEKAVIKLNP